MKGYFKMGAHKTRHPPHINENPVFYFICEGDTEIAYFEKLKYHITGLSIKIPHLTNDTDPEGLVNHAKTVKSLKNFKKGDKIICVFDCDLRSKKEEDGKNQQLENASKEARLHNITICFSNPSVELWFLLHFEPISPESILTKEDLIKRLKKRIPGYAKTGDFFDHVGCFEELFAIKQDHHGNSVFAVDLAIKNSKMLKEYHKNQNPYLPEGNKKNVLSTKCNPYTSIFRIVEEMEFKDSEK
jgi:hypothetical protein